MFMCNNVSNNRTKANSSFMKMYLAIKPHCVSDSEYVAICKEITKICTNVFIYFICFSLCEKIHVCHDSMWRM